MAPKSQTRDGGRCKDAQKYASLLRSLRRAQRHVCLNTPTCSDYVYSDRARKMVSSLLSSAPDAVCKFISNLCVRRGSARGGANVTLMHRRLVDTLLRWKQQVGARRSSRHERKKQQQGGTILDSNDAVELLGMGRNNTIVFRADRIRAYFFGLISVCVTPFRSSDCTPRWSVNDNNATPLQLTQDDTDAAIKFVPDINEHKHEMRIHAQLFEFFKNADAMKYCSLHSDFIEMSVAYRVLVRDPQDPNVPVYDDKTPIKNSDASVLRRFDGSLTERSLTEPELLRLARACAETLTVFHSNSWVHMDIKPNNVLVRRNGGTAPPEYVLGDYGIAEHYNTILHRLNTQKSLIQGTYGYMSPLLLTSSDESTNGVFSKFLEVARVTPAFAQRRNEIQYRAFWAKYFQLARNDMLTTQTVGKIDLHSLGILLLDLVPDVSILEVPNHWLTMMLQRMFFYSPDAWYNGADMLAYVVNVQQQQQQVAAQMQGGNRRSNNKTGLKTQRRQVLKGRTIKPFFS